MEIKVQDDNGSVILDIAGMVNIQSSPDLRKSIKDHVESGAKRVFVRLAEVEYMDSSGVGVLVSGMKLAKEKKVPFGLVEVAKPVMMVIEVTRLVNIFNIYPDLQTALDQLN